MSALESIKILVIHASSEARQQKIGGGPDFIQVCTSDIQYCAKVFTVMLTVR